MKTRALLMATTTLASLGFGAPAFAQAQAQAQPQAQDSSGLAEIVVTAQRHAQAVLTVPGTIQAETAQQLTAQGITNFTDLQFITPGYLPSDSSGYTQIFIRGIGNALFVGPDPSVATYVDDVPRIYGSMQNQLIDVERVEILKGAQGGLYGRNATGGVVNVITRQPSTEGFAASGKLGYGDYNSLLTAGYVNIPVGDNAAFSIAAQHNYNDPTIKNTAVKNPYSAADFSGTSPVFGTPAQQAAFLNTGIAAPVGFGGKNQWGADAKLLVQVNDNLKATFAGHYFSQYDTSGNQQINISPAYSQGLLSGFIGSLGFTPHLPPGFFVQAGKFQDAVGSAQFVGLHDWGGSATVVWNSPIADVTSITAYSGQHTAFFTDLADANAPVFGAAVNNKKHYWYQEIRAVSTTDGPFHWLGGATYLHSNFTGQTGFLAAGVFLSPLVHSYDSINDWTIYAQGSYDITSELTFTASVRYLKETNNALFVPLAGGAPLTPPTSAHLAEYAAIPSATLSYKLDDGTVYLRWARGFKAGGVNPVALPGAFIAAGAPLSDGSVLGPEKVDTFEVGYHQALFDHKLLFTIDAFDNEYTGLQESAHSNPNFPSIILAEVNADSARTWGVEGTANYRVIDPLTVGVAMGYLNAKFLNFQIANNPVLSPLNLSNTPLINAPEFQLGLTANLDQPIINDRFRLLANVLESHISSALYIQSGLPCTGGAQPPACLPDARGPGYWITNVRVGVKMDDKYELALYANNLFNEAYYTYGSSSASAGGILTWGNPRIFGAEFSFDY